MAELTDYEAEQVKNANRSGKATGGLRARAVAPAEQLGPVAHLLRGEGLRDGGAGLARRSRHRRRGEGASPRCSRTSRSARSRIISRTRSPALDEKPVVIGHSFGGLLTQILAGRGCAAASVAIDPAPFRGVLPLPISALKSAFPVLHNPLNHGRAVPLTYEQFRYAFANEVSEDEAKELFNTYAVPGSGVPLFQAATANLNPWTEAKVKSKNPDRGPMLIIDGRQGPHRSSGHRQGVVQAPEAQQGCDRVHRDRGSRSLAGHRPRLAGRGRHGLQVREAIREALS